MNRFLCDIKWTSCSQVCNTLTALNNKPHLVTCIARRAVSARTLHTPGVANTQHTPTLIICHKQGTYTPWRGPILLWIGR